MEQKVIKLHVNLLSIYYNELNTPGVDTAIK